MQMTALMNFLSSEAPKHDNIVAFLGAVPPTAHIGKIFIHRTLIKLKRIYVLI